MSVQILPEAHTLAGPDLGVTVILNFELPVRTMWPLLKLEGVHQLEEVARNQVDPLFLDLFFPTNRSSCCL